MPVRVGNFLCRIASTNCPLSSVNRISNSIDVSDVLKPNSWKEFTKSLILPNILSPILVESSEC